MKLEPVDRLPPEEIEAHEAIESEEREYTAKKNRKVVKDPTPEDIAARKHPLARCESCPLKDQPVVYGFGPDNPKYVVVGEAPGFNETQIGRPFVGKSGQLLRKVLSHHEISEGDVYFTNVCLCRPDDNKDPKAAAVEACSDRLHDEIMRLRPSLILAFGSVAGKALTGEKQSITKLRVSGRRESTIGGIPVACTFHPAAALRKPDNLPSIFKDVERATRAKSDVAITWQPTEYRVFSNTGEALTAMGQLSRYPELAIDVEVCSPDGESHGRPQDFRWLCIGVAYKEGKAVVFTPDVISQTRKQFSHLLQFSKGIYHNGKFDVQFLRAYFKNPNINVGDDTMLMKYAIDERVGTNDLEQVANDYLNAPLYKTEAKGELLEDERSLAYLKPETLHRYNATDVDVTYRLAKVLRSTMLSDGVERPYTALLVPASNVLAEVEYRGIRVDIDRLDAMEEEFAYALRRMRERFDVLGINPNSPIQVKNYLEGLGFNVPNTTRDTLTEIDHEFVEELLDYKKRHKAQSTYIAALYKYIIDNRVHPSYKLHGTETGRLSSKAPNIQNQPIDYGIRNLFVADDGKVLVQGDYSGIEMRLAAAFSDDTNLINTFKDGRSPHKEVATAFFGPDYTERQYVTTKSINFGILYRETAKHLAFRLKIDVKEAFGMIDAFHKANPGIRTWQGELIKTIHREGHLQSYWGRKRRFWLLTDDNKYDIYKEGCNFPLQSAASDFTLNSLIQLNNLLHGVAEPLITVHDSLVFQCEPEDVGYVVEVMKETMEDEVNGVPLEVEFKTGTEWGDLKVYG